MCDDVTSESDQMQIKACSSTFEEVRGKQKVMVLHAWPDVNRIMSTKRNSKLRREYHWQLEGSCLKNKVLLNGQASKCVQKIGHNVAL